MHRPLMLRRKRGPAILKRAGNTNTAASATSIVMTKPTGTVSGDILVAVMATTSRSAGTPWTVPAGWTKAAEIADGSTTPGYVVAYKVAGGSEPANYTFTYGGAATDISGAIQAWYGCQYDTSAAATTGSNTVTTSSVTAVGGKLLCFISAYGTQQPSTPSGMTFEGGQNAASPSLAIFSETVAAGATGGRTSTVTSGGMAGTPITLKP